jgi:hypothetical protein
MVTQHRFTCALAHCRSVPIIAAVVVLTCWRASTSTGRRLFLCLPLLLIFVAFMPVDALGKGGTNMHELANTRATVPTYQPSVPNKDLAGCGRGRYRDPRTHKCRGPADFGN